MTLALLTYSEKVELLDLLERKDRKTSENSIDRYYPDEGPLRRELYVKHLEFFAAGKLHRERAAIAANRVGKTEGIGGYEVALHLTGQYPDWWPGFRFDRPVNCLCGGDTGTTTRDIIVRKLLGPPEDRGTGLIRKSTILGLTAAPGITGHVDIARIQHKSGGVSMVQFRSYDQGRIAWQGTERDIGWLDEEPPVDIYTELLIRLMTTGGLLLATFTPLEGMSEVVRSFMPHLAPTETEYKAHA